LAHKAIAVGAVNVVTDALHGYSGQGPTEDGRYKPELVGPTDTQAASTIADNALHTEFGFGGTSGAAPYVAGAAMMLRDWFQQYAIYDAGHVYATLLAYGNKGATNNAYDNTRGAGRLVLPGDSYLNFYNTEVCSQQIANFDITVVNGRKKFAVALWWPESTGTHNWLKLTLTQKSTGTLLASSDRRQSVYEKLRYTQSAGITPGTYRVGIEAKSVSGCQRVYVAMSQT
jgi:hypothetical protein